MADPITHPSAETTSANGTGITAADLTAIVEQTWRTSLDDMHLRFGAPTAGPVAVAAAVSMAGAWRGHLIVGGSNATARRAAARLFDIAEPDVTADDISHALADLASIVAGQVTGRLPQPSWLCLPRVLLSGTAAARFPGTEPACEVHADWLGEPVMARLLREAPPRRR